MTFQISAVFVNDILFIKVDSTVGSYTKYVWRYLKRLFEKVYIQCSESTYTCWSWLVYSKDLSLCFILGPSPRSYLIIALFTYYMYLVWNLNTIFLFFSGWIVRRISDSWEDDHFIWFQTSLWLGVLGLGNYDETIILAKGGENWMSASWN